MYELAITLSNPYNDSTITIYKNEKNEAVKIEGGGDYFLYNPLKLEKYDDKIELLYSIGDHIIICLRNKTGLNKNATWIIYDKKFRLLKEYHNNTLILDYHYQD